MASADTCAQPLSCPARPLPRDPSNLTAPAVPRYRALPTALVDCPRCTLLCNSDLPARATAAKRKRLAATTAAVTSSMRTAQPARDCQARARDTRHARGRPRTHGLRSHQRCRAPAGRNADRVDVEARRAIANPPLHVEEQRASVASLPTSQGMKPR